MKIGSCDSKYFVKGLPGGSGLIRRLLVPTKPINGAQSKHLYV